MNKNSISTNEELLHGEYLMSVNGKYKAIFQVDCNLVIYGKEAIWQSDTAQSTGARLILQEDGNLVMYTKRNVLVWFTNCERKELSPRMRLTLTNHGHLELKRDGDLIWTSENSKGCKQ
ncbi:Lectin [Merluccius polli]|uniref:Lectin n=1 Tax=Merluccius polli TaxID=89951 RepID=A0AA47P5H2_MERPO|nr:Lectin [Merluccius polli]